MRGFLLQRLLQSAVLIVIVSLIGFATLSLMPGGPMAQYGLDPGMTQDDLARLKQQLGLDRPLWIQYLDWAWRLLQGDWGRSFRDGSAVLSVIGRHVFATFLLMGTSTIIAIVLGTWIGILGAMRRYSFFDYLATIGAMVALSIPTFWFGLVGIYFFSVKLGWLPAGNCTRSAMAHSWTIAHHLILPSVVLALVHVAIWSRYMRSSMLDVINQDFIRTARAKGARERRVLMHHVARQRSAADDHAGGLQLPSC